MKTLPSASLTSYQSGARATRAKTVGSLALGATALAAWPGTAEAQTIATGPGLQNHAGESYLINTLNMTTGITGSGNGSVPAGTWNLFFLSQSTGNSSENSYLTANGLNTGFGTAEVAEHNNGLSGQNVLSTLSRMNITTLRIMALRG